MSAGSQLDPVVEADEVETWRLRLCFGNHGRGRETLSSECWICVFEDCELSCCFVRMGLEDWWKFLEFFLEVSISSLWISYGMLRD